MKPEKEVRDLMEKLQKITGFINDFGTDIEADNQYMSFASNVADALGWVMDDVSTEAFRSDLYLNVHDLKSIARNIEARTGRKLEDHG